MGQCSSRGQNSSLCLRQSAPFFLVCLPNQNTRLTRALAANQDFLGHLPRRSNLGDRPPNRRCAGSPANSTGTVGLPVAGSDGAANLQVVAGGTACKTTKSYLRSDDSAIESEITVFYRRRDLLELYRRLEERGHYVGPLWITSGDPPIDYLVDIPPYSRILRNPHLKLRVGNIVATSLGLVIRRGS
jgi:hypothetical protein